MFIATGAARPAKLRTSGIDGTLASRELRRCPNRHEHLPLLTELGRESGVVVTINMALLTEVDRTPLSKMRVRCRVLWRFRPSACCRLGSGVRKNPKRQRAGALQNLMALRAG